ncbi:unnamed protein product [Alopecurus aequalis]
MTCGFNWLGVIIKSPRDAFDSAAVVALDAAQVPVTRLTMRLRSDLHVPVGDFVARYRENSDKVVSRYTDLVDVVLSRQAARRVMDLRLDAKDPEDYLHGSLVGLYTVTLDALPLELRHLELTNCRGILCQREAVLPGLFSLRLSHSAQRLSSLQRVMDAAPAITSVHLEHVQIDTTNEKARRLECPAATVLVLDSCTREERTYHRSAGYYYYRKTVAIDEIKAPRLRRFRYKGPLVSFSFSPEPLELEQVDLDFSEYGYQGDSKDPDYDLETFWRLARGFTSTKEMRLRMNHLEDMGVISEARRVELLPAFRRLECLEVHGAYWEKGKDAVLTILNMLRCCPMLSALRINLTAKDEDASNKEGARTRVPQKEIQIAALLGPRNLLRCLRSSLKRVGLQFPLEKSDCLGVKLIIFFAENAMVLEEMCIDGGDQKLCKHMSPKTEKWNSRRKKLGATTFVVLPLKS